MIERQGILKTVFDTANSVMEHPLWVHIDDDGLQRAAEELRMVTALSSQKLLGLPSPSMSIADAIEFELIAGSVNFCYWYGKSDVRPGGACSQQMYNFLLITSAVHRLGSLDGIRHFYQQMVNARYPLCKERLSNLWEVSYTSPYLTKKFIKKIMDDVECATCPTHIPELMEALVENYPGYAEDVFVKRASLFFAMLHNRFGWFADSIWQLPCPADYQVPKVLKAMGVLKYHNAVEGLIQDGCPIHKHGSIETEIRAATILAVERMSKLLNSTAVRIDAILHGMRNKYPGPFHLTLTTDY